MSLAGPNQLFISLINAFCCLVSASSRIHSIKMFPVDGDIFSQRIKHHEHVLCGHAVVVILELILETDLRKGSRIYYLKIIFFKNGFM